MRDVERGFGKSCSNIHILRLMRAAGVKVDSVSLGEIERALVAGLTQRYRVYLYSGRPHQAQDMNI
jgi:diaminopimelate decarboxylase